MWRSLAGEYFGAGLPPGGSHALSDRPFCLCGALSCTDGRIPALTNTYIANLDGSDLTGVNASNAGTLDALDSSQFLRSDVDDTFTGDTLTVDAGSTLGIDGTLSAQGNVSLGTGAGGQTLALGNSSNDIVSVAGETTFTTSVHSDFSSEERVTLLIQSASSGSSRAAQIDVINTNTVGTDSGLRITNTNASTEDLDAGVIIENLDLDNTLTNGLVVQGNSVTTAFNAADADIDVALDIGPNELSGTNFPLVGDSGDLTTLGNVVVGGRTQTDTFRIVPTLIDPACTAAADDGKVYYDISGSVFCFCENQNWFLLGGASAQSGQCGIP